jgi:hypothetical protein
MRGIASAVARGAIRPLVSLVTTVALITVPVLARQGPERLVALSYKSNNGFLLKTQGQGILMVESPWRESVRFRLKAHADSIEIQFGEVAYRAWPDAATLHRNNQTVAPDNVYDALVAAGLEHASWEFWTGLAEAVEEFGSSQVLPVASSCAMDGMNCFWSLVLALGSFALLLSICGGTLGLGCLPALAAHIGVAGLASTACARWLICIDRSKDPEEDDRRGSPDQPVTG